MEGTFCGFFLFMLLMPYIIYSMLYCDPIYITFCFLHFSAGLRVETYRLMSEN